MGRVNYSNWILDNCHHISIGRSSNIKIKIINEFFKNEFLNNEFLYLWIWLYRKVSSEIPKNKNFHNVKIWDDKKKTKTEKKLFLKFLDFCDYIVLSPGINLKKSKLKNKLLRNKHKIITDLDLFYLLIQI